MQHHNFSIGQELIFRSATCSVVRILEGRKIQLEKLSGELSIHSEDELLRAYAKKQLIFIKKATQTGITLAPDEPQKILLAFPVAQQDEIMRRTQYAMLVDQKIKTHGIVGAAEAAIKQLHQPGERSPCVKTVYAWHMKWRRSGRNVCSLADKQRGRPKISSVFSDEIRARIYQFIGEHYLNERRSSLNDVYDLFEKSLKKEAKEAGKLIRIPSRATFYRHLDHFEAYDIECQRNGRLAADRKFRYIGAGILSTRALERAEIDHTPLDVILLDEAHEKTLGRAWLTLILDHYTKIPLGFYISHNAPAQVAVLQAMRCAILPKIDLAERYPNITGNWPCYGVPSVLVFDNALEFHAHNIRRACATLGITMLYCPPRHPHYKGSIERFLGTLNRSVCHIVPGTTKSNIKQRGDYDAEGMAAVTVAELNELITLWIVDVYMNQLHRGINDTPRNAWNKSVIDFPPVLPTNCEEMEIILSHQGEKTLSGRGIVHNHLWYNCDELHALYCRTGENSRVRYHFNVHDMGYVWVIDEIDNTYIKVPAIFFEYADGLSLEQHREIRKLLQLEAKSTGSHDAMLEGRHKLYQRIEELSDSKKMRDRRKASNLGKNESSLLPHRPDAPRTK